MSIRAVSGGAVTNTRSLDVRTETRPSRHRADLQGLRAIASLLVAVYHTWIGTVSGGVDIFFVVTGMLITTTLLGGLERTGHVDVRGFLVRLAGRLLPLAGIVLALVSLGVLVALPTFRWADTFQQVFAAATYWENWLLADLSTDYLAQGADTSPVQHFWAMSVQGQFYLIWAALFVLVAVLIRFVPRCTPRRTALCVVAIVTVASAGWALYGVLTNPVFAYFDTFARLWEFGLGALVAIAGERLVLPRPARVVLGVAGLALVCSAGFLPAHWHYPGPIALWPALGAVAILLSHRAGDDAPGPVTKFLSWRPLAALGGYSYGLYLFSWAVLVGYRTFVPGATRVGPVAGALVILVSLLLAVTTIRGLRRLDGVLRTRRAARRPDAGRNVFSPFAVLVPITAAAALLVPLAVPVATAPQHLPSASVQGQGGSGIEPPPAVEFSSVDQLQNDVRAALAAGRVPDDLDPGFGDASRAPEWIEDGCGSVDASNVDACRYSDGDDPQGEIIVIGDSQAVSWMPGLRAAVDGRASIQLLTREMCPVSIAPVSSDWQGVDAQQACLEHNEWVMDEIRERAPLLVVMSFGVWQTTRVQDVEDGSASVDELVAGTRPYLAELQALGTPTVWLDSPPPGAWPEPCALARTSEQFDEACVWSIGEDGARRIQGLEHAADDFGIPFVSTASWFCDPESGGCPAFVDSVAVQADGGHLTWGMSRALAPLIGRAVGLDTVLGR